MSSETKPFVPKHGMQKRLWMIRATDIPGSGARDEEMLKRHLAHQDELERQGILFGAGPVFDEQGNREYGMIIIRAESAEDARRIADTDPMFQEKRRNYTIHQWLLNEGRINLAIDFSTGKCTLT